MNVGFLPLRAGSKGIPGKNKKPLFGVPLFIYTLDSLLGADDIIDQVVVATDDSEIIDMIREIRPYNTILYHRDPENAQDESSTESVLFEYLSRFEDPHGSLIFLAQATNPFLITEDIKNANCVYNQDGQYNTVLTVTKRKSFVWSDKGVPQNYDPRRRPRRQDFSGYLVENGALYIFKDCKQLHDTGSRLYGTVGLSLMDNHTHLEIDEPNDFLFAEALLEKFHGRRVERLRNDFRAILQD